MHTHADIPHTCECTLRLGLQGLAGAKTDERETAHLMHLLARHTHVHRYTHPLEHRRVHLLTQHSYLLQPLYIGTHAITCMGMGYIGHLGTCAQPHNIYSRQCTCTTCMHLFTCAHMLTYICPNVHALVTCVRTHVHTLKHHMHMSSQPSLFPGLCLFLPKPGTGWQEQ